jgi:hypothetical protein
MTEQDENASADWARRGKPIRLLIRELMSFEDQELEVRISTDGEITSKPISLVCKRDGSCMLENHEDRE